MVVIRRLGFLKIQNFNSRQGWEDQCASSCQILWQLVKLLTNYDDFGFFKMAAIHHVVFLCVCLDHPQKAFGFLNCCT